MPTYSSYYLHPKKPCDFDKDQKYYFEVVDFYYSLPGNGCGGACHIVLDDYNLDDDSINFCIQECLTRGDWFGEALMKRLLQIPTEKRKEFMNVDFQEIDYQEMSL